MTAPLTMSQVISRRGRMALLWRARRVVHEPFARLAVAEPDGQEDLTVKLMYSVWSGRNGHALGR